MGIFSSALGSAFCRSIIAETEEGIGEVVSASYWQSFKYYLSAGLDKVFGSVGSFFTNYIGAVFKEINQEVFRDTLIDQIAVYVARALGGDEVWQTIAQSIAEGIAEGYGGTAEAIQQQTSTELRQYIQQRQESGEITSHSDKVRARLQFQLEQGQQQAEKSQGLKGKTKHIMSILGSVIIGVARGPAGWFGMGISLSVSINEQFKLKKDAKELERYKNMKMGLAERKEGEEVHNEELANAAEGARKEVTNQVPENNQPNDVDHYGYLDAWPDGTVFYQGVSGLYLSNGQLIAINKEYVDNLQSFLAEKVTMLVDILFHELDSVVFYNTKLKKGDFNSLFDFKLTSKPGLVRSGKEKVISTEKIESFIKKASEIYFKSYDNRIHNIKLYRESLSRVISALEQYKQIPQALSLRVKYSLRLSELEKFAPRLNFLENIRQLFPKLFDLIPLSDTQLSEILWSNVRDEKIRKESLSKWKGAILREGRSGEISLTDLMSFDYNVQKLTIEYLNGLGIYLTYDQLFLFRNQFKALLEDLIFSDLLGATYISDSRSVSKIYTGEYYWKAEFDLFRALYLAFSEIEGEPLNMKTLRDKYGIRVYRNIRDGLSLRYDSIISMWYQLSKASLEHVRSINLDFINDAINLLDDYRTYRGLSINSINGHAAYKMELAHNFQDKLGNFPELFGHLRYVNTLEGYPDEIQKWTRASSFNKRLVYREGMEETRSKFNSAKDKFISKFMEDILLNNKDHPLIAKLVEFSQDNKYSSNELRLNGADHPPLLKKILQNVDEAVAIEVLVWLQSTFDYFVGHIDLLCVDGDNLYICDYKPDLSPIEGANPSDSFINSVPQIASYALALAGLLGIDSSKIYGVIFNKGGAWVFNSQQALSSVNGFVAIIDPGRQLAWSSYFNV